MKNKILNKLTDLLFYLCILIFTIGLNLQDTPPPNGWYQQWLPDLSGKQIKDMVFLDSLIGYAAASQQSDSSYVLKTTNGGDNWQIIFRNFYNMSNIKFLDINTGFVEGSYLYKTTDGGISWNQINKPAIYGDDMFVLNEDTIWLVDSESLVGGVFRTTNGGVSWQQQLALGSQNPTHIYFYNGDIGFIAEDNDYLRKTTNSGVTWSLINGIDGFRDIYFADSLTGWKCSEAGGFMKKTTDGGQNWVTQTLASGGIIQTSGLFHFSNINRDTIWGAGGYVMYPNYQIRALLHRTTNGGENWFYQIADTSIHVYLLYFIDFIDKNTGWAYDYLPTGIHTKSGGDTTFLPIKQISSEIPINFILHQNYPNPFNNETIINYKLKITGNTELSLYDISGKLIKVLIKERQYEGSYEYRFNGAGLPSGVYFYRLTVNGKLIDTKKAVLIK